MKPGARDDQSFSARGIVFRDPLVQAAAMHPWVDEDERVLFDVPRPLGQDRDGNLPLERLVLDVAREPFLRLDRRDVVLYRAHDGRKLRVAGGLDPIGGLPDEPRPRLREMGKKLTQKVVVLLFRPRGDYGIIHGAVPFSLVFFALGSIPKTGGEVPLFCL